MLTGGVMQRNSEASDFTYHGACNTSNIMNMNWNRTGAQYIPQYFSKPWSVKNGKDWEQFEGNKTTGDEESKSCSCAVIRKEGRSLNALMWRGMTRKGRALQQGQLGRKVFGTNFSAKTSQDPQPCHLALGRAKVLKGCRPGAHGSPVQSHDMGPLSLGDITLQNALRGLKKKLWGALSSACFHGAPESHAHDGAFALTWQYKGAEV